jgi:hypothetical protein
MYSQFSSLFSVPLRGRSDLKDHLRVQNLTLFWQEPSALPGLTMFKSADPVHTDLLMATEEETFASLR